MCIWGIQNAAEKSYMALTEDSETTGISLRIEESGYARYRVSIQQAGSLSRSPECETELLLLSKNL